MNPNSTPAKAQIVEKLRASGNVLVTVSRNPSIDQLAALIALTLLLNRAKKNATAVFSGQVPATIDFLNPTENIAPSADSLRDFIISIDKSKADKLRYKLEDDVVKIFITPYRTNISEKDLKFSAGEFNVDVVVGLGVQHQQDLDDAISAHGRILHDAAVVCLNNVPGGDFGVAHWESLESSSLTEMVAELVPELGQGLVDPTVATALLTGIVAETKSFSNEKTHPRTMEISSQLLAAGADQKLVNLKLQETLKAVVNPTAGSEVAPTVGEPLANQDSGGAGEELIIDEHGGLSTAEEIPVPLATVASAPTPATAAPVAPDVELDAPLDTVLPAPTPAEVMPSPSDKETVSEPTEDDAPLITPSVTEQPEPAITPEPLPGPLPAPKPEDFPKIKIESHSYLGEEEKPAETEPAASGEDEDKPSGAPAPEPSEQPGAGPIAGTATVKVPEPADDEPEASVDDELKEAATLAAQAASEAAASPKAPAEQSYDSLTTLLATDETPIGQAADGAPVVSAQPVSVAAGPPPIFGPASAAQQSAPDAPPPLPPPVLPT